jgi:hypothetical protein
MSSSQPLNSFEGVKTKSAVLVALKFSLQDKRPKEGDFTDLVARVTPPIDGVIFPAEVFVNL